MNPHDNRHWTLRAAQARLSFFCVYAAIVGAGMLAYAILCEWAYS